MLDSLFWNSGVDVALNPDDWILLYAVQLVGINDESCWAVLINVTIFEMRKIPAAYKISARLLRPSRASLIVRVLCQGSPSVESLQRVSRDPAGQNWNRHCRDLWGFDKTRRLSANNPHETRTISAWLPHY